ncbi:MAG: D-amino-acid transaminase [Beijerinckiaceae bacterium]|nr:D-amino-acid transaminase [Beijerinckiaceae bacterium]
MTRLHAPRIVYVNGAFLPFEEARIPIMDRGFLFGDGIYEVTAVLEGRLIDNDPHLLRLDRSLAAIGIRNPYSLAEWTAIQRQLMRDNALEEGLIYIEVTRGVYEREFTCPPDIPPTVVMFTQVKPVRDNPNLARGAAIITVPDLRWARRDIKSTALLAQVLAKQAAKAAGVAEAWMVEDGFVTEGASSTAFLVTEQDEIITRPLSQAVLPGITRMAIIEVAKAMGLRLVERPFSVEEIATAREAFFTSASTIAMPVVQVDGRQVGGGQPGPVVRALRERYMAAVMEQPREDAR